MRVDFVASQPHYVDHLRPVWHALRDDEHGTWTVPPLLRQMIPRDAPDLRTTEAGDVVLVASYTDALSVRHNKQRKIVLMEHGTGQSYGGGHAHYAGGVGREFVHTFLSPNQFAYEMNTKASPMSEHVVVGSPRVDDLIIAAALSDPYVDVAVSFHWDCDVYPETRSAYSHFAGAIAQLASERPIVGHSHPRAAAKRAVFYASHGVPYFPDFTRVVEASRCYVCDNSSTIYEFAAVGRPVVLMNAPTYRRTVEHGLRFWALSDVGLHVNDPGDLTRVIDLALSDPEHVRDRREAIVDQVYPWRDGRCAERVTSVLRGIA